MNNIPFYVNQSDTGHGGSCDRSLAQFGAVALCVNAKIGTEELCSTKGKLIQYVVFLLYVVCES